MLFITITCFACLSNSIEAFGPPIAPITKISGHVYYKMIKLKPDDLRFVFPSKEVNVTLYEGGYYNASFSGIESGSVGTFYVTFYEETEEFTITMEEGVYNYEKDLYFGGYYPPNEPTEPTKPSDSGSSKPKDTNKPPIAITNGPYNEFIEIPIEFKANESYDPDGRITKYEWNFGDQKTATGEIVNHTYKKEGKYTVTITVTDNKGKTGTAKTYAIISLKPNHPPEKPKLTGLTTGNAKDSYLYTAIAKDPDEHDIKYFFIMDNTKILETDYVKQNTSFSFRHIWGTPGVHTLEVYVEDTRNATSNRSQLEAIIGIHYVKKFGYLKDYNSDGIYNCLLYTSPSPRDRTRSRMPSSA